MKIFKLSILLMLITTLLCSKEDISPTVAHPELVGTWKREVHWGSIDGTETIIFRRNSTYEIILERTENFSGPCSLDSYCNNNYSGKFWFEGEKLFYNHSSLGWTDYWSTWSVQEGCYT